MITINKNQIFFKIAARALFTGLETIPVAGAVIKIGYDCWKVLKEHQESMAVQERIDQLEAAATLSPDEALQAADAAFEELKQEGQKMPVDRTAAVQDLISVMPSAIREKTKATLQHARKHGTAAATVLPVTSHFKEVDQKEFYTGLFPQRRPQFKPGDAVPNYNPDWKLERLIGAGGFGEVWLARNQRIKSKPPVAIKFCQDTTHAKLMQREAKNLDILMEKLPLGTPHIVGLVDAHLTNQPYWLMFEYIDGGTLEHRMRLGPMDWPTAWQLFEPILQGISQVHEQGIVHRDLKPANILLANGIDPRIADFGIGKIVAEQNAAKERASLTFTTTGYGTASYMSPEQAEGAPAHPSDDIYALGIILWQMLSGTLQPLQNLDNIQDLAITDMLKKVLIACRFFKREKRPQNAKILFTVLANEAKMQRTMLACKKVIQLEQHEKHESIATNKFKAGDTFHDPLKSGGTGPELIVIDPSKFALSKYPVTFEEYDIYCKAIDKEQPSDEDWGRGNRPVINVTWWDAIQYCAWLSGQTGYTYRLPSETEWEQACRADGSGKYSLDQNGQEVTSSNISAYAWYEANSDSKTHPVGEKLPNALGLYDMHGNVWEWMVSAFDNDKNDNDMDANRVIRGGSWESDAVGLRASYRVNVWPGNYNNNLGLRLARIFNS